MEDLTFPAAGEDRNISHWLEESRMKVAYTFRDPENPGDVTSIGIDPAERVKYGLRDRTVAARATIRMSNSSAEIRIGVAPVATKELRVSTKHPKQHVASESVTVGEGPRWGCVCVLSEGTGIEVVGAGNGTIDNKQN